MPGLKINNIKANGFLSFGENFEISELDERINFIVGPNASGKTNFLRLLKFIKEIAKDNWEPTKENPINFIIKRNDHKISIEIDIEIILDKEEIEMISLFTAVLLRVDTDVVKNISKKNTLFDNSIKLFESLWGNVLKKGKLKLEYDDANNRKIRLNSFSSTSYISIDSSGSSYLDIGNNNTKDSTGFENLPEDDAKNIINNFNNLKSIDKKIKFSFDQLDYNNFNNQIDKLVENKIIKIDEKYKLNKFVGDNFKSQSKNFNSLFFNMIFSWIFGNSIISLDGFRYPVERESLTIKDIEETKDFNGLNLYPFLFRMKIYEIDKYNEIKKEFKNLSNGIDFDVKINSSINYNEEPLFPQSLYSDSTNRLDTVNYQNITHKFDLDLFFKNNEWYPSEYSSAGYYEMLLLTTIIAGVNKKVIVIDEPAQNLHPTFQHKFLQDLYENNKEKSNQFFIITHSPDCVSIGENEESKNNKVKGNIFVFKYNNGGTNVNEFKISNDKSIPFIKYEELKRVFFAKGIILVEGFSEEILIKRLLRNNAYFTKIKEEIKKDKANVNIDDIEVVNIEGVISLQTYINLSKKNFKLPYVAIIDADIFDPNASNEKKKNAKIIAQWEIIKNQCSKKTSPKEILENHYNTFFSEPNFEGYTEKEFGNDFQSQYCKWCSEKFGCDEKTSKKYKKINYPLYLTEEKIDEIINNGKLSIYKDAIKNLIEKIEESTQ